MDIEFKRLTEINRSEIVALHTNPLVRRQLPLSVDNFDDAACKKWGERHPWADVRNNWDGLVMLYTPLSESELEIAFQLIVESYNHVTGQTLQPSDFQ